MLLDGIHGAGKSTAMTQLALWARTNGWIVVRSFVHIDGGLMRRGIYIYIYII